MAGQIQAEKNYQMSLVDDQTRLLAIGPGDENVPPGTQAYGAVAATNEEHHGVQPPPPPPPGGQPPTYGGNSPSAQP